MTESNMKPMDNLSEMEELKVTMDEALEAIELRDKFIKLANNPLFNEVIGKRYIEEESVRCVALLGDDNIDDEVKAKTQKMILGIAYLQNYFRKIQMDGNEAENMLEAYKEEMNNNASEVN